MLHMGRYRRQQNIGAVERILDFEKPHSNVLKIENIPLFVEKADLIPGVFLKEQNKNEYFMPFYAEVKKRI